MRIGWAALAAAFLAGAVYSSFLVLREAPVGPPGHGAELRAFVPELRGQKVLFAGQDRFAAYELLGADTDVPLVEFPDPDVVQSPTKPFDTGDAYSPIDFDSFTYGTLNHHRFVITGSAAWNSRAPRNFREVGRTPSFILWGRKEKTPQDRQTLLEGTEPAAPVDCAAPETRIFVAHRGRASVFPTPVIGPKDGWEGGPTLKTGESTAQTLELPAGRWRLSLQYFSPFGLTLSAPGFSERLVPALDGQRPNTISLSNDGQYWPAGEITTQRGRAGPLHAARRRCQHAPAAERLRRRGPGRAPGRGGGGAAPDDAAGQGVRALARLLRGHRRPLSHAGGVADLSLVMHARGRPPLAAQLGTPPSSVSSAQSAPASLQLGRRCSCRWRRRRP